MFNFFLQAFWTWRCLFRCRSGCVTASSHLRLPCSRLGAVQKSQGKGTCKRPSAVPRPRPGTVQNTWPGSMRDVVPTERVHAQSGSVEGSCVLLTSAGKEILRGWERGWWYPKTPHLSAASSGCQHNAAHNATLQKKYAPTFSRCVYYYIYYKVLACSLMSWVGFPSSPFPNSEAISQKFFVNYLPLVPRVGKAAYLKSMNDPILVGQLGCGYKARDSDGVLVVVQPEACLKV